MAAFMLGRIGADIFRNGHGHPPPVRQELGAPIYCGGPGRPYVALTFDDGPGPYTPQLLAVLRRNGARATFFEIGRHAARRPDLVRRESSSGVLGDHSWSHPELPGLGRDRVTRELTKPKQTIEQISGRRVLLFRPPFGAHDRTVDAVSRRLGMLEVLWSVDSGDASAPSTPSSAQISRHLSQRVRPGGIVLLHEDEVVPRTVDALKTFLPELHRRGLHPVTVPELLRVDPPAPGQVANGVAGCSSASRQPLGD